VKVKSTGQSRGKTYYCPIKDYCYTCLARMCKTLVWPHNCPKRRGLGL